MPQLSEEERHGHFMDPQSWMGSRKNTLAILGG
jgi:hypothetical protein